VKGQLTPNQLNLGQLIPYLVNSFLYEINYLPGGGGYLAPEMDMRWFVVS